MPQKLSSKKSPLFVNLIILLFVIFATLLLCFLIANMFSVKTIQVNSDKKVTLRGLTNIYHTNILFLNEEKTTFMLQELNPQVKKIEIKKEYPNKISFYLEIQTPIAALATNNGFFLLGDDARIIEKTKVNRKELPVINYYQKINYLSYNSGQTVTFSDLKAGLAYLKKGLGLDLTINTLDIKGEDMIALKLKDKEIIFSSNKEENSQLYQFESIIRQFKIKGINFKKIDLRFDKPVVEFN